MPSFLSNSMHLHRDLKEHDIEHANPSSNATSNTHIGGYSDSNGSSRKRITTIANPSPAGVFAFASTTFLLSMYNINARGVMTPNIILGMAVFAGGLLQFIAGMWQFPRGNVFSATVFSTYGTFWMSYAVIHIPASGVIVAYSDPRELGNAMGLFLITWFMITVMFILPTLRRNVTFTILLSVLAVAFLLLAIAEFTQRNSFRKGGGVAGLITGAIAYYVAVGDLLDAEPRPVMVLPQGRWYDQA